MKVRAYARAALTSLVLLVSSAGFAKDKDSRADAATIKARQHFFGPENVDPVSAAVRKDRVIFSWFSNTSFAVAAGGRVFLLDSYIDQEGRVPTSVAEITALKPEAIFIGHGHFDHLDFGGPVAVAVGATLVASPEACDQAQLDAQRVLGPTAKVNCLGAVTRGSSPGAEINSLDVLRGGVCVTAFKHIHSAALPSDPAYAPNPINPVTDARDATLFPPPPPIVHGGCGGICGLTSIMYQFTVGNGEHKFTFLWHNTTGPYKEKAPQIFDIARKLPKTDVELGAIFSIGWLTNYQRDAVLFTQALQPKLYVPTHHDLLFLKTTAPYWKAAYSRQLDIIGVPQAERPLVRWLYDPDAYLSPSLLTFDIKDDFWASSPAGRPASDCESSSDED
jgi:hypothetical protein